MQSLAFHARGCQLTLGLDGGLNCNFGLFRLFSNPVQGQLHIVVKPGRGFHLEVRNLLDLLKVNLRNNLCGIVEFPEGNYVIRCCSGSIIVAKPLRVQSFVQLGLFFKNLVNVTHTIIPAFDSLCHEKLPLYLIFTGTLPAYLYYTPKASKSQK